MGGCDRHIQRLRRRYACIDRSCCCSIRGVSGQRTVDRKLLAEVT